MSARRLVAALHRPRIAVAGATSMLMLAVALASTLLARDSANAPEAAKVAAADDCACLPKPVLPVALEVMGMGSSWVLTFDTPPCPPVVELLVGTDGAKPRSLGRLDEIDPRTGKRAANHQLVIDEPQSYEPPNEADRKLQVQLVRRDGSVDGPYALRFSPREERLAAAKLSLERSPRTFVSFAEHGSVWTWLFFSQLFEMRHSLREVRFSIDDCSLGRSIRFEKGLTAAPIVDDQVREDDLTLDRAFLTLPKATTRSACVQAVFVDGTSSAVLELVRDPRHRIVAED